MHSVIIHSENIKIHEFFSDICVGLCWAGAEAGAEARAGAKAGAGAVWFSKTEAPRPEDSACITSAYYAKN